MSDRPPSPAPMKSAIRSVALALHQVPVREETAERPLADLVAGADRRPQGERDEEHADEVMRRARAAEIPQHLEPDAHDVERRCPQ
ncbi:MAG TPA: hypothetical protein VFI04_06375 [Gaiellaceae bacterium]|nr:hypothetical protein [Gaiellaceae bacterium]